ncbi:MAG: transposase [Methylobacter sp.]|nr:transposase [Candidatus Methylobacter titanis]
MARPIRIEYAGALYHITSRGNAREAIFFTDEDRLSFLKILQDQCRTINWLCHAYCLMDNHYHLLIETPDGNLSKGMRQLNGVYTQTFNRHHNRVGHVFQGRYKGILVEKEAYLLELCRYIVLNPVRAQMVRSAKEWPWSSYCSTAGYVEQDELLTSDWILASFAKNKTAAQIKYREFISQGKGQPSPWQSLKNQVYLGNEQFVKEHIDSITDKDIELSEIPKSQRKAKPKTMDYYLKQATNRDDAILRAWNSGGYTQKNIADYFSIHYSRVSKIIKKAKDKT